MSITVEQIEFYLVILVRITAFFYTAPFFSIRNVPQRVKVGFSLFVSLILFLMLPYEPLEYTGVIGYAILIIKEGLAGAIMGLFCNIAYFILDFVGQRIDMDMGFSMMSEFNPMSNTQVTVTGNLYSYAVMLILMITNMHHYILTAIYESFVVIPVGKVVINPAIYEVFTQFMLDYFLIGFRIVMPIFATMLLTNTILGILAKISPQMNMFVIGLQLKVFVGIAILYIMIRLLPGVANMIFEEMMDMVRFSVNYLHE